MKILLACNAGMSTSILERSMQKYMKENNIEGEAIAMASERAKHIIEKYDIVLLGPQVRFMLKSFEKIANGKPVLVINPMDYAMAKAENVMKTVIEALK